MYGVENKSTSKVQVLYCSDNACWSDHRGDVTQLDMVAGLVFVSVEENMVRYTEYEVQVLVLINNAI